MPHRILFIVEGLGLSSTWPGNALLAARPRTFFNLFNHHSRHILQTCPAGDRHLSGLADPNFTLAAIGRGVSGKSNQDRLDELILSHTFYDNPTLTDAILWTKRHFSSLHTITTLSEDNIFGKPDHLEAIIQLAKQKSIDRLYLHLILSQNKPDRAGLLKQVAITQKILEKKGLGEIATISGQNYFKTASSERFVDTLCGRGLRALSIEQVLARAEKNNQNLSDLSPAYLINNHTPVGILRDFDSLLFTDSAPLILKQLIFSLAAGRRRHTAKSLLITTFFPLPLLSKSKAGFAFDDKISENLISILTENGFRVAIISEGNRLPTLRQYLFPGASPDELFVPTTADSRRYISNAAGIIDEIARKFVEAAESKKYDFVILDLPYLVNLAQSANFATLVRAVQIVDEFMGKLVKFCRKQNSEIFITANAGKVEALPNEDRRWLNLATTNPVPFIFVDPKLPEARPIDINLQLPVSELIRLRHSLADITPTILARFGLPVPDAMTGRPLLF
ncbi:MAG: hypothetical protein AAB360_03430 [Patescibacteria group bacterium]